MSIDEKQAVVSEGIRVLAAYVDQLSEHVRLHGFRGDPYGIPRKLKCGPCQVGDHEDCEGDECYCDCEKNRSPE